jgi:hypothetical protein
MAGGLGLSLSRKVKGGKKKIGKQVSRQLKVVAVMCIVVHLREEFHIDSKLGRWPPI